ncbi:queuosine-tRNA galactosyltransferase isoform X2 [Marmota flaviventris]
MMPERVRLQHEAAVQHPTSIIGCRVRRDPPGSTERYTRWINQLAPEQLLTQVFTANGPTVIMPTWFCSRAWFSHVGPFDEGGQVSVESEAWGRVRKWPSPVSCEQRPQPLESRSFRLQLRALRGSAGLHRAGRGPAAHHGLPLPGHHPRQEPAQEPGQPHLPPSLCSDTHPPCGSVLSRTPFPTVCRGSMAGLGDPQPPLLQALGLRLWGSRVSPGPAVLFPGPSLQQPWASQPPGLEAVSQALCPAGGVHAAPPPPSPWPPWATAIAQPQLQAVSSARVPLSTCLAGLPVLSPQGVPEDLLFFYQHLRKGGRVLRVDQTLLLYRYHPHAATLSVLETTIWTHRVCFLEEWALPQWASFTIWNAGKQGRRLYRSLTAVSRCKVVAFCDVDENKIRKGFYRYEEAQERPKPRVPVLHFRAARPPFVLCVKLDLTGGEFEENLRSLQLQEGRDFVHFS